MKLPALTWSAGIHRVMFPQLKQKDVEEILESLKKEMTFEWVNRIEEVVNLALIQREAKNVRQENLYAA